ncbi:MAG: hypothetical protein JOZ32_18440 [Bryobacterales bacterium]|nr:hypothetical protein [Bryobacterales bacterium]
MRTKTVQVTIQDLEYANCIRKLLSRDGSHRVHLVERPDVNLDGVIMVDAAHLDVDWVLANEPERLVVIVHKERDNLLKIWDAGVKHVVFHDDPPHAARIVVLSVELVLGFIEANSSGCGISPYFPGRRVLRDAGDTREASKSQPTAFREASRRRRCRVPSEPVSR